MMDNYDIEIDAMAETITLREAGKARISFRPTRQAWKTLTQVGALILERERRERYNEMKANEKLGGKDV